MDAVLKNILVSGSLLCLAASGCQLQSRAAETVGPSTSSVAGARHETWTILLGTEAEKMTRPCSRSFPERLVGSWRPSPAEVEAVERSLPSAIDAAFLRLRQLGNQQKRPERYYRQYAGFVRDGKRVIYVNAIRDYLNEGRPPEVTSRGRQDHFIDICDGGAIAFGAVYDIERAAIDSFSFNGGP
jgi:hypothetical protein